MKAVLYLSLNCWIFFPSISICAVADTRLNIISIIPQRYFTVKQRQSFETDRLLIHVYEKMALNLHGSLPQIFDFNRKTNMKQ